MKIKSLICAFLLTITCSIAGAQSSRGRYDYSRKHPDKNSRRYHFIDSSKKIVGRFNFLGLLDPYDENASIGAEYKFAPQWSFGMDAAYIFNSAYLRDSKQCQGFIFRPFLRFYPDNGRREYFEAELHYKHVSYQLTGWQGKDVIDGVPSYEEYTTFHYIKNAYGVNIKFGTWSNLTNDKKLRLEYFIGLGLRFKRQHSANGSYSPGTDFFMGLYKPDYATPVLPMGIRLVYDLKTL